MERLPLIRWDRTANWADVATVKSFVYSQMQKENLPRVKKKQRHLLILIQLDIYRQGWIQAKAFNTFTIFTGLMLVLHLVCPLRNGGSSSTKSISKSSSEWEQTYTMNNHIARFIYG